MFDRLHVERARGRINTARERISALSRQLEIDLATARTFTSPDYSAEGLVKERERRVEQVRARHREAFEQLQAQVANDRDDITRWADKNRPTLGDDPASLQRAQMAWDGARMRLEAGMPWQSLVAGADETTLLAVQEWGPAWLEAQTYRGSTPDGHLAKVDPKVLASAVDARLLEVTSGGVHWALEAQTEADVATAGFAPMSAHVHTMFEGGPVDPLHAAVAAHIGAQMAAPGAAASADQGGETA